MSRVVFVYSRPVELELEQLLTAFERDWCVFVRTEQVVFGAMEELSLESSGDSRFSLMRSRVEELFRSVVHLSPGPAPRLLGGFSFDGRRDERIWGGFPEGRLVLHRYQYVSDTSGSYLSVVHVGSAGDDVQSLLEGEWERVLGIFHGPERSVSAGRVTSVVPLTSEDSWHRQVEEVRHLIRSGALEKLVLSRVKEVTHEGDISGVAFRRLVERYPDVTCYLLDFGGHRFYGATPETLVRKEGRAVWSEALAGSSVRGGSPEEDDSLAVALLSSEKDVGEHMVVRRRVSAALSEFTHELWVQPTPEVVRLSYILHLRSELRGELYPWAHVLQLVEHLHPTPALGGEPRSEALGWIRDIEDNVRGWYGAPVGWLDSEGDGHFFVAIRSAKSAGCSTYVFAGAGIMADSDPAREWWETELKFHPILKAMGWRSVV